MPLLPSALPPKGEASRYGVNNFLNSIALPRRGSLLRSGMKRNVRRAPSRIVIPSAVEGSLRLSGIQHTGGHVKTLGIICFTPYRRLRLTGVQERFLAFARNDDAGEET